MRTLSSVCGIASEDFRERYRRFSFVAMAAIAVIAAFWAVPNPDLPITSLIIEPQHFAQASNPTWIPISAAMCIGFMLPLFGFVFVKNAIDNDRHTGVFEIFKVSPSSSLAYVFGKFISNVLLLFLIIGAVCVGSLIMVLVKYPGQSISAYEFLTPYLSLLPNCLFLAAAAVLFEVLPVLRSGAGTTVGIVIFFSLFVISLTLIGSNYVLVRILDVSGYQWFMESINNAVQPLLGRPVKEMALFAGGQASYSLEGLPNLFFTGISRTPTFLLDKLGLTLLGLVLVTVASLMVRLDEKKIHVLPKTKSARRSRKVKGRYVGKVSAEFFMLLRGKSAWWWLVTLALWVSSFIIPTGFTMDYVWPLLLLWCLTIFSKMGCSEHIHGIIHQLQTIDRAPLRQWLNAWISGSIISLALALPVLGSLLLEGQFAGALAAISFALFIVTLAAFLGELTKVNRTFETVFVILYFLSLNNPSIILPVCSTAISLQKTIVYFTATIIMFIVATTLRDKSWRLSL